MTACCKRLMAALLLWLLLPAAQAAIVCTSITSPGVSINYANGSIASVQTFFTVSCTRSSASDPVSVTYDVTADNGVQPNGVNNRARHSSGAEVGYDVYTSASCGTSWKGNRTISDTITWSAGSTGTISRQTSYWGCITSAQTATASGLYADTVGLRLTYNNIVVTGSAPVSIFAPAVCRVTTSAGTINVAYAAFGIARTGSTTFALNCTAGMPYTIATDVSEGVLTGLRYVLSLSNPNPNGTGAPQVFTVTATFPAGQAGSCATASCNASRTHTLTVSY